MKALPKLRRTRPQGQRGEIKYVFTAGHVMSFDGDRRYFVVRIPRRPT